MKFIKSCNIDFLSGLVLLFMGSVVSIGWITHNKLLITFFSNQIPVGFLSLLSIILSGIFFFLKWMGDEPFLVIGRQVCAVLIMILSLIICILISLNFSLYAYFFPAGEFSSYFSKTKYLQPNIMWLIAGYVLFRSTKSVTNRQLSYLETINFTLLFFAILGLILSFHEFTLIYTWLNQFSMSLPYAIGLTLINLGMIINWGEVRRSNYSKSGEEDRQIRFFSISMLTQAIMSAVFLGAMIFASQNEAFLKSSLEQYASLKAAALNNTIANEIEEVNGLVEAVDINLTTRRKDTVDNKAIEELKVLSRSQNFNGFKIIAANDNKVLFSYGKFVDHARDALFIKSPFEARLVKEGNWYIYFKAPLTIRKKIVAFVELQKPIDFLRDAYGFSQSLDNLALNERYYICDHDQDKGSYCISYMDNKRRGASVKQDVMEQDATVGATFMNKIRPEAKIVSIEEELPALGLRFLVRLNISDIEDALLNRVYIALPIIIIFIFFFIRMLHWHILPIFRRTINAEKDAVEAARMLMESESRIRTIMDNIGECVIVFLPNGKIESFNQTALKTFAYDQNSAQDLTLSSLFVTELSNIDGLIDHSLTEWSEVKGIRSDGSVFDAQIKIKDLTVRQQQLYIAIVRDISEQKYSEHKLLQSEKVFRNSFDHAPIGMMVLDTKNKITQVNQALCSMLGYHESELKGNNLKKILPEDLRLENALPFVKLMEMGIRNFVIESPLLTKSGEKLQTISTMTLFISEVQDESFFVVQIENVTMRQRYEEELKAANAELEYRFAELEIHTSITEELNTMNGVLQSCLTIDEALPPIEKFAKKFFKVIPGAIYLTAPESGHMELAVRWGEANVNAEVIKKQDCWALRRSQPYSANRKAQDIGCYHYEISDISGHMCIPLTAQGDLIGLMTIYYLDDDFDLHSSTFKRLALSFSDHIALSLSNIRLRERLQHQSISDPLTNLYNRRYFDTSMNIEMLRSERKLEKLSLLLIDIDYFKNFNDTYGHDLGDTVLQEVSSVIKKHIRESDTACRMGGEEFAIIMPETSKDIAFDRAEILRQAISRVVIKNSGHIIEPITVSIGIAVYPDHARTVKFLSEAADAALYQAKGKGRNQTVMAQDIYPI